MGFHSPLLEEEGYEVETGGALAGSSGLIHAFDLVASKGNRVVCFDYVGDLESLLEILAKALDVDHVEIYAVSRADAAKLLPLALESNKPKFLLFESEEELASKVKSELGARTRLEF